MLASRSLTCQRLISRSPRNHITRSFRRSTNTKSSAGTNATSSPATKSFAERHPFALQLGVATAKTSAADAMVQIVVEKKSPHEIDYRRNAIFVVFGFAYLGGFQYWLMVNKFGKWFPTRARFSQLTLAEKLKDTAGMLDALKMVAFDVFVHLPLIYFPSYYTCKEIVTGTSWNPLDWVKDGCAKYWANKEDDLTAMIKLWGPSDCIQFSMPIHISMPFRHLVSLNVLPLYSLNLYFGLQIELCCVHR